MKKIAYILIASLLLSSCNQQNARRPSVPINQEIVEEVKKDAVDVKKEVEEVIPKSSEMLKAVVVEYNKPYYIKDIKSLGFKSVILSFDGVRIPNKNYRTNYKVLDAFKESIDTMESFDMPYVIEVTSGPGFSNSNGIYTIFHDKAPITYYSQMVIEMLDRCNSSKNFKGISININNADIPPEVYYSTLNSITDRIIKAYPNITIIYNLHSTAFEDGFKGIPEIKYKNAVIRGQILLSSMSYPGYGAACKSTIKINKNIILSGLQNLKTLQKKKGNNIILSAKAPWADKSDIFLQDFFELTKMLDFDTAVYSSNSGDIFDLKRNKEIQKVLKRNSQ